MKTVRKAYAKINLTLEILDRRPDGYHNIRSVMQKIDLCDTLSFEKAREGKIFLTCDKAVCAPEDNLAYRAAALYRTRFTENTGRDFGLSIVIEKKIPDRAGLAGGSADAAAVLDHLFETEGGLSYDEVEEIAAMLGSDINFCLDRYRCALCTDRGIKLEPISPLCGVHIVLSVPDAGLKTPDVYAAFDASPVLFADNPSEKVKTALESGQNEVLFPSVKNAFTPICRTLCPEIGTLLSRMRSFSPKAAEMSGSGSAVFGLFTDAAAAQDAYRALLPLYPKTFSAKPITDE